MNEHQEKDALRVQHDAAIADTDQHKRPFEKPKLTYVAPKLVRHGSVQKVKAGFFGGFYP